MSGLKLALEEIQKAGGILGRPVELRIEDNASTQIHAASPAIAKVDFPTGTGSADPSPA